MATVRYAAIFSLGLLSGILGTEYLHRSVESPSLLEVMPPKGDRKVASSDGVLRAGPPEAVSPMVVTPAGVQSDSAGGADPSLELALSNVPAQFRPVVLEICGIARRQPDAAGAAFGTDVVDSEGSDFPPEFYELRRARAETETLTSPGAPDVAPPYAAPAEGQLTTLAEAAITDADTPDGDTSRSPRQRTITEADIAAAKVSPRTKRFLEQVRLEQQAPER